MYTIIRLILHVLYLSKKLEGNPICGIYKLFSQDEDKNEKRQVYPKSGSLKIERFPILLWLSLKKVTDPLK